VTSQIGAVILAAGTSSRMGGRNKLLCQLDGMTLIERATRAALDSRCTQVVVVTGWEAEKVEAALARINASKPLMVLHNPQFAIGLSTSLCCGLGVLPETLDGALIQLADMPWVGAAHIDRLIDAFDSGEPAIVAPFRDGRRGHPVLWPRDYFGPLKVLQGDVGARFLLERFAQRIRAVPFADDAIFEDIDTRQQLAQAQRR
jgi:molybdenum cofactor cytidylyltransferase